MAARSINPQASNPKSTHEADFADIQGLLRFGFGKHTDACFLLLRVKDRTSARTWLASAPVTSAVKTEQIPETILQVALTAPGLQALGVADDILDGFSPEFLSGMGTDANRARRLGDVGTNDPSQWQWGGPQCLPHVLVMLYALPGRLDAWQQDVTAQMAAGFEVQHLLTTTDMQGVEPFGFADGIAQPRLDWQRARPVQDKDLLEFTNLSCLGEFVLGYPNEYGRYTDRPLLDPGRDRDQLLPRAEDTPNRVDLGRNGTYLVFRQLRQDVHGFWQFLDQQASGGASQRQQLAEAMVGRRMNGEPLVMPDNTTIAGIGPSPQDIARNGFTYEGDPEGLYCPFGAHIRRSNPRTADFPSGITGFLSRLLRIFGFDRDALRRDIVAATRFHRILRRGREYGTSIPAAAAIAATAESVNTGLHFMCLNANIARQFEFVQGAWLMGTKFNGMRDETDPLLGNRCPVNGLAHVDTFSIPHPTSANQRIDGLPQFVTVVGGAYFFLPGIRALQFLMAAAA